MKPDKVAKQNKISKSGKKKSSPKQQFWGERLKEAPEQANIEYCAGRDVAARPMADAVLVPFDCWQNLAHVTMLAEEKIIPAAAAAKIKKAVAEFEVLVSSGKLSLNPDKEDVHTNIEHFVAGKLGKEISGFMHTGRSRNDQTTTVVRMFIRDRLTVFADELQGLIESILQCAEKYEAVPIGGFTHYQPASITTVGHWLTSYAQMLSRDLERLWASLERINISPLGAAASFGTSWPINRERTAELLGFNGVQENSMDCITNRWEMEADAGTALEFCITHLSILSQDLIILSMPQFGIVEIADRFVTGSSIMPQKRNPDFAEVTRAKAVVAQNLVNSLFGIARGALSGYNRDTQWTKYLIIDLFDEVKQAPAIFRGVFDTLTINVDKALESASQNFVNAVDVADALAQESGLPFRTTYEIASKAVRLCEGEGSIDVEVVRNLAKEAGAKNLKLKVGTPEEIAQKKKHTGATSVKVVRASIKKLRAKNTKLKKQFETISKQLAVARKNM